MQLTIDHGEDRTEEYFSKRLQCVWKLDFLKSGPIIMDVLYTYVTGPAKINHLGANYT